ncbi:hypothetical protein HS041_11550 [Planomonospora sp. ID67723]|uniref:hypothetical protein n=1 Tax=Planomonospora sp. ID67723 TaxID=2738134 RepID=UPI0018C40075|nr:hypothetical protein [Planomonospora sp. ID67723]MBG0828401.1 hypothetical protein [Planomonospora sp. ID67723]
MADHNDAGSRGSEDAPRDPAVRDGDTTALPATGQSGEQQGPSAPGPAGPRPAAGPYGPYGPGGPGWSAPGWTATAATTATAPRPPRSGRYARTTRGKTFQIIAAALVGALLGGGTVAVLDRIGDRHRAGHIAGRMDDRPGRMDDRRGPQDGDRAPWRERWNPDGERGHREGPRMRMPRGDGSHLPRFCEPIEGGFKCTLRSPEAGPATPAPAPTAPTPSPSS